MTVVMKKIECLAYWDSSTRTFLRRWETRSRFIWVTTLPLPNCTLYLPNICSPISMLSTSRGGVGLIKPSLTGGMKTYRPGFPDLHQQATKYKCQPYSNMMNIRQRDELLYKASRRSAKARLGPGSGELTLNGIVVDQISFVHAQQPAYGPDLSEDSSYANVVRRVQWMIEIITWEKIVAEISMPCSGQRTANEQSVGTHRTGVSMDEYWRTLLANITKQDGTTFTYKTYTDFCTIFRKAMDIIKTRFRQKVRTHAITARRYKTQVELN
jgi:hypothetical protein